MPFLAFWYAFAATHRSNFDSIVAFAEDCAAGSLPHVAVVDPPFGLADDHPPHDPTLGEKFIGLVVDALTTSQSWHDTALLIVFDEHGGFYDHVPPEVPTIVNKWNDTPYGFRVPALLISPFTAGRHCVKTVFDHTSFMKSIHERWNVDFPKEEYDVRWTGANSIWDAFDFQSDPIGTGIYTGVTRDNAVAALNWATGVYDRLRDGTQRFEQFLDRIFVLPELKMLDRRAALFDTLNAFEHHVITQKRMFEAAHASEEGT
jgi:phospholipase C